MSEGNPIDSSQTSLPSRRWRRRVATVATVLCVAAIVQWNRDIGLLVLSRWHHWQTGAEGVDTETAREMVRDGAIIIDVRKPEEFFVSHIAGAINIPMDDLHIGGQSAPFGIDDQIVVYCTIGRRSGMAAKRLNDGGISAYNLVGGILMAANDFPDWVESPSTNPELHVWSDDYSWLVPPGFSAVTFSAESD